MAEFIIPDFLQNADTNTIHEKMMSMLPANIDKTEGGFPWDFTRPTALIASELLQFHAVEILKLIFPQWSWGPYLDMLGQMVQVTRKSANYATAVLTITGRTGTHIQEGTVFCTEAEDTPSIEFAAVAPVTIPDSETAAVTVRALEPGTKSNVDAGTIVLMVKPVSGIEDITNEAAATGGTEEETDDEFRERILEATRNSKASYIGNMADFKRWAESVDGMGTAVVMFNWNGPETVKIVCVDANGAAANQAIRDAVYDYIMRPDSPMERLAPPNVILTVSPPVPVNVSYTVSAVLKDGFTVENVTEDFADKLTEYYKTVPGDGELKLSTVAMLLSETEGVYDHTLLKINGAADNVDIGIDEYPVTVGITITEISEV